MDAEREIPKEDDFQNETRRLPLYWPEDEAGEVHSALGREQCVQSPGEKMQASWAFARVLQAGKRQILRSGSGLSG